MRYYSMPWLAWLSCNRIGAAAATATATAAAASSSWPTLASTSTSSGRSAGVAFVHRRLLQQNLNHRTTGVPSPRSFSQSSKRHAIEEGSVCDVSSPELEVPDLVATPGSAEILRGATLRNVSGDEVCLGDCMGEDVSIVVFLRHLA
mmetsp:Transcript_4769/g.10517  ORF Transcript_4769/g.10517 Transcript_4769/m.10517 type:complete len:147 (+) Transcript_4769:121-561(+)